MVQMFLAAGARLEGTDERKPDQTQGYSVDTHGTWRSASRRGLQAIRTKARERLHSCWTMLSPASAAIKTSRCTHRSSARRSRQARSERPTENRRNTLPSTGHGGDRTGTLMQATAGISPRRGDSVQCRRATTRALRGCPPWTRRRAWPHFVLESRLNLEQRPILRRSDRVDGPVPRVHRRRDVRGQLRGGGARTVPRSSSTTTSTSAMPTPSCPA